MATTTNYAWETPDDTDLVKDGASAIRTLGSSIDTTTKALNPSTTLGDIEYRSATANTNTRLGIGSTGNVLTVAGGVPTWAAPVNGKVLQVVNAVYTTQTSSSSSTYADTGLTATITPSSVSSKIMVFVTIPVYKDTNNTTGKFKLFRAATSIATLANAGFTGGTGGIDIGAVAINYLDSPATTSATTYKVQFGSEANNSRIIINIAGSEVNSSSITLMEIGA
jgi:hypothetical protein